MFTVKQDIAWWSGRLMIARKYKLPTTYRRYYYQQLLIGVFTHLFNERLCCPDCSYWNKEKNK